MAARAIARLRVTMNNKNVNRDQRPHKPATGLTRIINAFWYSLDGFRFAFRNEAAFRQELALAAVLIPLALWLPVSAVGKALMIGAILLVLIVELLNSAIETTVDHVSLERHPLAKYAKDMGSAAVLLSLLNALIVWLIVLFG